MRLILATFLILISTPIWAGSNFMCVEIFAVHPGPNLAIKPASNYPPEVNLLLAQGKPQEAIWWLIKNNQKTRARGLEARLLTHVNEALHRLEYTPEKWQELSKSIQEPEVAEALNSVPAGKATSSELYLPYSRSPVYKVNLEGVEVAIKFSETAFTNEPVAYQVARVLEVQVPMTVGAIIGGRPASVQLFIGDRLLASQAAQVREVEELMENSVTFYFDRLLMNNDRHSDNFFIDVAPEKVKSLTAEEAATAPNILIDNEVMFNNRNHLAKATIQDGVNNLKYLLSEDPGFARRLALPTNQMKIFDIVGRSSIPDRTFAVDYLMTFLSAYSRAYKEAVRYQP